jgi:hypothetical protein
MWEEGMARTTRFALVFGSDGSDDPCRKRAKNGREQ